MRRILPPLIAALLLCVLPSSASAVVARDVKVVGGAVAAPGQFPWMVAIIDSRARRAPDGQFCGGALVAPKVVLTAAHCVHGSVASEMDVVVGRTRLSNEDEGQRIDVVRIAKHPEYDPQTVANDVALLELATPVTTIVPIALGQAEADAPAGRRVMVAGWGRTQEGGQGSDSLKFVRLTVRSTSSCTRQYGSSIRGALQVCAGSMKSGEDSCQGDSGGPLFVGEGDTARTVGIVSFGEGCGRAGVPGVYARVSGYLPYITQQIALLNGDTPAPTPETQAPRVRISRITCNVLCRVELKVTGREPAGGIVVNVVRARSKGKKAVDRFVFAKKVRSGTWRVLDDLPFGRLTLYAIPLTKEQDDLDGDGDVERIEIVPG